VSVSDVMSWTRTESWADLLVEFQLNFVLCDVVPSICLWNVKSWITWGEFVSDVMSRL
jgi:hypothetical protein